MNTIVTVHTKDQRGHATKTLAPRRNTCTSNRNTMNGRSDSNVKRVSFNRYSSNEANDDAKRDAVDDEAIEVTLNMLQLNIDRRNGNGNIRNNSRSRDVNLVTPEKQNGTTSLLDIDNTPTTAETATIASSDQDISPALALQPSDGQMPHLTTTLDHHHSHPYELTHAKGIVVDHASTPTSEAEEKIVHTVSPLSIHPFMCCTTSSSSSSSPSQSPPPTQLTYQPDTNNAGTAVPATPSSNIEECIRSSLGGDGLDGDNDADMDLDASMDLDFDASIRIGGAPCVMPTMNQDASNETSQWQSWSCFLGNEALESPKKVALLPAELIELQKLLKKRTGWRQRKHRMQRLHRQLHPFDQQQSDGTQQDSRRVMSFSLTQHAKGFLTQSKKDIHGQPEQDFASFLLAGCTQPVLRESPVKRPMKITNSFDDNASYDSDPECFMTTSRESFDKENCGPSRVNMVRASSSVGVMKGQSAQLYTQAYTQRIPSRIRARSDERGAFLDYVEEWMNCGMTVVWHDADRSRPVAVKTWVERGQRLNRSLVPPKLCWKVDQGHDTGTRQHHRQELAPRSLKARPVIPKLEVRSIELLDIVRILTFSDRRKTKSRTLDRKVYPFCKEDECFMVRGLDGTKVMFQTQSRAQRSRMVYGLKLLVARFGSKVLMSDPTVFEEFFATVISGGLNEISKTARKESCARHLKYA